MLDADVPRYHQIYLHLRAEIADGAWVGRNDFPGEVDLAERFGVSVITSRRALRRLTDEQYIERGRGKRTRVVRGPTSTTMGEAPALIQTTPGTPRLFKYQVLSRGVQVAPAEACAAFGLPAGTPLWTCSRLRSHDGRPHSVTLNVQHVALGMNLPLRLLKTRPMSEILRSTGTTFSRLSRKMSVAFAPPSVAQHLGLTLSDPTLIYTFTHHDLDGVVVQWVRIWVRGDEPTAEEIFDYNTGSWSMSSAM